jgi:hypothetical protein
MKTFYWGLLFIGFLNEHALLAIEDISAKSKTSSAINVRLGDSELTGIASLEFQYHRFSVAGGWRPYSIIQLNEINGSFDPKKINSFGLALTIYNRSWNQSSSYLTIGATTEGYGYKDIITCNEYVDPSFVAMAGLKNVFGEFCSGQTDRVSLNSGIGFKTNLIKMAFVFEVVINFAFFARD